MKWYFPGKRFPQVSLTGRECGLSCLHCGGKYLRGMTPATENESLVVILSEMKRKGARGVLVSGGCAPDGTIPVERFASGLARGKQKTGLVLNVHTGFASPETLALLGAAGVDILSLDVVGSPSTVKEVYGLDKTQDDYANLLKGAAVSGVPYVVPHVCIGLHGGELKGELDALRLIKENCGPATIVFLILIPTKGTPYEDVTPPSTDEVGQVFSKARQLFPDTPLVLGCMRPRGIGYERAASESGADGIVNPSLRFRRNWEASGRGATRIEACCAVPKALEREFLSTETH